MAVYRYKHDWCGFNQDIFLESVEKSTIVVPCYRCGRDVVAHAVRDKSIKVGEADGQVGLLRKEKKDAKTRRSGSQ